MRHQLSPGLAAAAFCAVVLTGCGTPPQPLPTSAPQVGTGAESSGPASGAPPLGALPTAPTVPVLPPGAGLPVTLPPVVTVPAYPPPTTTTTAPTTAPTRAPAGAALCKSGPSKAQILAVVVGKPGIPDEPLKVSAGPYCSGGWQFAQLQIKGKGDDEVDPLLVVTNGKPAALKLVEAGGDVCSDSVQADAPTGIRVRACGF